jgi:hypothetical protein
MRDWLHQFDEVVTMLSFVWHVLSFFHQMAYLQPFSACKGCTIGELILGRLGWLSYHHSFLPTTFTHCAVSHRDWFCFFCIPLVRNMMGVGASIEPT